MLHLVHATQLIPTPGGLTLSVIAVWVTKNRRNPTAVLVRLVFLLAMTTWALVINLRNFIRDDQWVLAPLDAIIFGLAVWLIIEAAIAMRKAFTGPRVEPTPTPTEPSER